MMTFKEFHEAANREIDRYYDAGKIRRVCVEVWDGENGREVYFSVAVKSEFNVEESTAESAIAELKKLLCLEHAEAGQAASVDSIGDIPSVDG